MRLKSRLNDRESIGGGNLWIKSMRLLIAMLPG